MTRDHDPETLTIPDEVRRIGLEAAWELASTLQHIVTLCPLRGDGDQTPLVVRGMALRGAELTSVLMAMLDDDLPKGAQALRSLKRQVVGEEAVPDEDDAP